MKPYGRDKRYQCHGSKIDHHMHDKKHRKVKNWWEVIIDCVSRGSINHEVKKEIRKELDE